MTHIKTLTAAALISAISAPAFATSMVDLKSMTCADYNDLSDGMQDRVAMMAVAELNDSVIPSDGTATATDSSVGMAATESESGNTVLDDGSATATSISNAGDDMSRYAEEIAVLNRTCDRNGDAMILEAAIGSAGTK